MKVFLRLYDRYWTGKIGSEKDGSNIFFVMTPEINQAKDFGAAVNALSELHYWCPRMNVSPLAWEVEYGKDESYLGVTPQSTQSKPSCCNFDPVKEFGWECTITWGKTKNENMRTLDDICKDAERFKDNSVELFNLLEELKVSTLSESHRDFAREFVEERIESLKDKLRKRKAKKDLSED